MIVWHSTATMSSLQFHGFHLDHATALIRQGAAIPPFPFYIPELHIYTSRRLFLGWKMKSLYDTSYESSPQVYDARLPTQEVSHCFLFFVFCFLVLHSRKLGLSRSISVHMHPNYAPEVSTFVYVDEIRKGINLEPGTSAMGGRYQARARSYAAARRKPRTQD